MLCLEIFTNNDIVVNDSMVKSTIRYHYDYMYDSLKTNLSNYSDKFINNIIMSFVQCNIFKSTHSSMKESWFTLNTSLECDIDMIKIFHNINNTALEIIENTMIELAHERNDILMCNINHIVKTQTCDSDTLYSMCKNMIKLFDVTKELYDKAIHTMIEKKYIADDLKKITWV